MGKRKKSAVHEENIEEDEQNHAESSSSSNDKSLYEILGVEKTASQQEIKKAYHKLALRLHPDKNPGDEDAKEKFQHLQKIISILGDEEKRAVYDQTGCVDDADLAGDVVQNLKDYFRSMYKKVTEADIEEFESNYRGSESEKNDLIDLYKKYKGHMNRLFCSMLCSDPKLDSHRFKDILDEAISAGELKSTKAYQKWGKQVSETKPPVNPLQRRGKSNTKIDSSDSSDSSELINLFLQGKREVDALIQSLIDNEEVMSLFTGASSSNRLLIDPRHTDRRPKLKLVDDDDKVEVDLASNDDYVELGRPPCRQRTKDKRGKGVRSSSSRAECVAVNIVDNIDRYTDIIRNFHDKYDVRQMKKALKFFQEMGDTENADAMKEKISKRCSEMFDL